MNTRIRLVLVTLMSLGLLVHARAQTESSVDSAREQAAMERAVKELRGRAIDRASEELAKTTEQLATLRDRESAFEKRVASLMQSEDGKRLAADRDAVVAMYQSGFTQPVVTFATIDAKVAELERARAKLSDPSAGESDEALASVRDVPFDARAWAQLQLARLTERDAWFTGALERAPKLVDPSSAPTLEKALEAYAVDFDKWSAQWFRMGVQLGKTEKEQEIVERGRLAALLQAEQTLRIMEERHRVQLEEARVKHESEIERRSAQVARLDREIAELKAKGELERVKHEGKKKEIEDDTEHQRLIAKCKQADVQQVLAPFITPGYWQIIQGAKAKTGVNKKPLSFNALQTTKALGGDETAALFLVQIATNKHNDRPRWPMKYDGGRTFQKATVEQREMVRKAQEYLAELGPTLVELGMLGE